MTVIQQLRVIAGGKHLIVYREGTGYVLRPYIKDGRKYEDVLFTGTPDQFLQYGKYNMKDRREALIKEAYPLTLNGYSERIQKNEYAERELKKFRRDCERSCREREEEEREIEDEKERRRPVFLKHVIIAEMYAYFVKVKYLELALQVV